MDLKFTRSEKIIGVVFSLSSFIIYGLLVGYHKIPLLFYNKITYQSTFETGVGLGAGNEVILRDIGLVIGSVTEVVFNSDNTFTTHYEVFEQYSTRIKEDTVAYLSVPMFGLGASTVELTVGGRDMDILPANSVIPSYESSEGQALTQASRYKDEQPFVVDQILHNVALLTDQLNDDDGPILLTLRNIKSITQQLAEGGGISYLYNSPDFYNSLYTILDDVHLTLYNLEDITEETHQMVKDIETMLDDVSWTTRRMVVNVSDEIDSLLREITQELLVLLDDFGQQIIVFLRNIAVNSDPFFRQLLSSVVQLINSLVREVHTIVQSLSQDITSMTGDIRSFTSNTSQEIFGMLITVQNILDDLDATLDELSENTTLFPEEGMPTSDYLRRDLRPLD